MTIAEKIIARHCRRDSVEPGDMVTASVDMVMANDITAPLAIEAFRDMGAKRVFDPGRVALALSHFAPARDIESARLCQITREFAHGQEIRHFIEAGQGIEHVVLPEEGMVLPGELVLGADSHTCTYGALGCLATGVGSTDLAYAMATGETWLRVPETLGLVYEGSLGPWVTGKDLILYAIGLIGCEGASYMAIEFSGPALEGLCMDARLTMANMAVEAGAKCGIFPPDKTLDSYVTGRAGREYQVAAPDPGAVYAERVEIDASAVEPQVSLPSSPANTRPARGLGDRVDQVFIGSCTNGRIDDLRSAARVLSGRRVDPGVRLLVIPGSLRVYRQALAEGLIDTITGAGGVVGAPTCGPCLGGHSGVLGPGERCATTSNRNFVGRMGDPESEAYLVNPAVAAATAVAGHICHPEEVGQGEKGGAAT